MTRAHTSENASAVPSVPDNAPAAEVELHGSLPWITIAAMAAVFMAVLDISITQVALNEIRGRFAIEVDQISWVTTSYAMAEVTTIPLSGWLQKRVGIRRYFIANLLIFTAASALCGTAWSLPSLVFFRTIQGLTGGALIPTCQTIVMMRYPKEKLGTASALVSLSVGLAPLIAPTLGGFLIEAADWRFVFFVNVPIGIGAAYVAWAHMEQRGTTTKHQPVDVPGIVLLVIAMATGIYVLEEGNREGWAESNRILFLSVVSVISLVMFVVHELDTPNPIVNLQPLKNPSLAVVTLLFFVSGIALFGSAVLYTLFCGTVMRYAAIDIGLLSLKAAWIQIPASVIAPLLARRIDPRRLVLLGLVGIALALWHNARLSPTADASAVLVGQLLRGAALGFAMSPLTVLAFKDLPPDQRSAVSVLTSLSRTLGGTVAISVLGTMLANGAKSHAAILSRNTAAQSPIFQQENLLLTMGMSGRTWDGEGAALRILQARISFQGLARSFNDCYLKMAVVVGASAFLVFLVRRSAGPST